MAHGVQPSAPAAACCNRRPSARRAIYLCKIPGAPLLSSGTRAAMHTALIGDYLVHFRSIGPAAPTASAPRLDLPGVSAAVAPPPRPPRAPPARGGGGGPPPRPKKKTTGGGPPSPRAGPRPTLRGAARSSR